MAGMARMGRRRTSQGEKGVRLAGFSQTNTNFTDLHGFFYLTQKPGRVSFKENQENPLASM